MLLMLFIRQYTQTSSESKMAYVHTSGGTSECVDFQTLTQAELCQLKLISKLKTQFQQTSKLTAGISWLNWCSNQLLIKHLGFPYYYKLMQLYLQTNTFYIFQSHILTNSYHILPPSCSHLRMLFAIKKFIILTTYNIGRYNMDNKKKWKKKWKTPLLHQVQGRGCCWGAVSYVLGHCPLW